MCPHPLTEATPFPCAGCGHAINRRLYLGTDYISRRRFPVIACERCGLIQTAAAGSDTEGHDSYSDYYGKRQGAFEPITNWLRRRRVLHAIPADKPGILLDVGCGRGGFLAAMRSAGWRVAGVERSVPVYQDAWRTAQLDVSTREWEQTTYSDASFDVVTFWHVFEHLHSPGAALDRVSRVLKSNGTVVIAVPNIASVQARLFRARWFHLDVPRHLVHYSFESLSLLLREHHFDVVSVHHYSFEYDTFGAIQSVLNVCCRTQNLLFDLLTRRRSPGAILQRAEAREVVDLLLTVLLTVPLGLAAVPICWLTSWAKQGATIEIYAKKSGW